MKSNIGINAPNGHNNEDSKVYVDLSNASIAMLGLHSPDVESVDNVISDTNLWQEEPSPQPRPIPTMSQWAKVQQNNKIFGQMQQFYQAPFTMEVRFFLCQWIEQQQWDQIDETNQEYAEIAERILQEMMQLLRQKEEELTSSDYFIIRYKLQESVQKIESMAQNNPLDLIHTVKQCLEKERELIAQQEQAEQQQHLPQNYNATDQKNINERIMADIQILLRKSIATENDLKNLQHAQESFIIKFSDSQKITGQMQQLANMTATPEKLAKEMQLKKQKEELDLQLAKMAQALLVDRTNLSKKYEETIQGLEKLQRNILDRELIAWKRQQQLAGNGLVMDPSSLETLQKWCESLADLIWQNRQQIKKTTQLQQQLPISCPDGIEDLLPKLNDTITGLLSSLVTSTFIVEQQPPQVLKKDARFGAVVRLLVGGKLNVHMNPPIVKATIISENQAKDLLRNEANAKNDTCGDILNNNGSMEYHQTTSQLSISFRNMQLKKIKRADKKGSEAVTEEKFCILFQSEFSVGGNELSFHVWTLSLPVVVTVHGNQECNATATVLWDNAFSEAGRIPFGVPDTVEWKLLADQLSIKFMSQTGKGLSETNLSYIASKLFGESDPSNCKVSWGQFNKDTLPGRTFTFWEWFCAIQKLTKEHLKDVWTDGAIIGFVSKQMSTDWLSSKPQGTFLLRFSDSEIGGITIAWLGTGSGDFSEVWNLAPFTTKDFNIRGLADRIKDLTNLVYLYPNIPKGTMFSKYYSMTEDKVSKDGYIRPELKTTIPQQYNQQDIDIYKPFSPDQPIYECGPMSIMAPPENCDELPPDLSNDFSEVDLNSLMDYNPSDIYEISVNELLSNQSI